MNISITSPPLLTGDDKTDLTKLHSWCTGLYMQLKRILYSIDSGNITELDASKLNGIMSLDKSAISGLNVSITGDSFKLTTPDESQYLIMENGTIKLKGKVTAV